MGTVAGGEEGGFDKCVIRKRLPVLTLTLQQTKDTTDKNWGGGRDWTPGQLCACFYSVRCLRYQREEGVYETGMFAVTSPESESDASHTLVK